MLLYRYVAGSHALAAGVAAQAVKQLAGAGLIPLVWLPLPLPGGVTRLITWDYTARHQLNRVLKLQNNVK